MILISTSSSNQRGHLYHSEVYYRAQTQNYQQYFISLKPFKFMCKNRGPHDHNLFNRGCPHVLMLPMKPVYSCLHLLQSVFWSLLKKNNKCQC